MSTHNRQFYNLICALWNDDDTPDRVKLKTLQDWTITALLFGDSKLADDLEFLSDLLIHKGYLDAPFAN